ncbi:molybdate ABC transporter permease subunit [Occultella glacieicola]|uniref:Molybdenum transport system permease n=1 Tax=Occultella glacieicola TaxID=2518684 RepID=A0ABY2E4X6_9MICO|nr:ABC transporter permease [Occultella glacieicola]TDE94174.1 molybdate ABC transporter permease subunit [Occultella glacieicola]
MTTDPSAAGPPGPAGPTPAPASARSRGERGAAPRPLPVLLAVPAVLGLVAVLLPLVALFPRVDWATFPAAITSPAALSALSLSLRTGLAAMVCCLVLGVPLALYLSRAPSRLAEVLRIIVTLPLVLPPLVGGMALLYLFGVNGYLGQVLTVVGITVPFTTLAVVMAQTFVAMPFLVISLEGALRTAGTRYEYVAATLGAGRWTVLRRITLPLVMPGLIAGTVLAFARAVGEFGATALFAGNQPGVTQTMPMAIYTAFNGAGVTRDSALALAVLLVVVSLVILLVLRDWRRREAW